MLEPRAPSESGAPVRLAVLGCGAVTELLHLPAARHVPELRVVSLVDRNFGRANALAKRFRIPAVRQALDRVGDEVDAVLVALPNHLHAQASIDLLSQGVPVLVEKPLALSVQDARAMVAASQASGALLQAAHMNRFARGALMIKEMLEKGALGAVAGFTIEKGEVFDWPLASGSGMVRSEAGGGVLTDFGSHLLDLLCWWLGEPRLERYVDDSRGGVEADCEMSVTMVGSHGRVRGEVRFSRIRDLGNLVRIVGEHMTIEWAHSLPDAVRVRPTVWGADPPRYDWAVGRGQTLLDLYAAQLRSFAQAVSHGLSPAVSAPSVLPSLALIERCYGSRRLLERPWEQPVFVPAEAAAGA